MKKILKINPIFTFILGLIIAAGTVYAAVQLSADEVYFNSTNLEAQNVQAAIDEVYNKASINNKKCKRATILHNDTCISSSAGTQSYCISRGIKNYSKIEYGNLGTSGSLIFGDAFDCDVNGDGIYSAKDERFYYISDYYDTTSKTYNSNYATLLYYSNVVNGQPNNNTKYLYSSTSTGYNGPDNIYAHLPSTSQWSNISLKKLKRDILDEADNKVGEFTYTNKAARLLTRKEALSAGCTDYTSTNNSCLLFFENTRFHYLDLNVVNGYWLETSFSQEPVLQYKIDSSNLTGYCPVSDNDNGRGVRPVIDVAKSDMDY